MSFIVVGRGGCFSVIAVCVNMSEFDFLCHSMACLCFLRDLLMFLWISLVFLVLAIFPVAFSWFYQGLFDSFPKVIQANSSYLSKFQKTITIPKNEDYRADAVLQVIVIPCPFRCIRPVTKLSTQKKNSHAGSSCIVSTVDMMSTSRFSSGVSGANRLDQGPVLGNQKEIPKQGSSKPECGGHLVGAMPLNESSGGYLVNLLEKEPGSGRSEPCTSTFGGDVLRVVVQGVDDGSGGFQEEVAFLQQHFAAMSASAGFASRGRHASGLPCGDVGGVSHQHHGSDRLEESWIHASGSSSLEATGLDQMD